MPKRTWRWLARHPWVTSLIMVTAFALLAGWRDVARERGQTRYDQCVSRWADQITGRSTALSGASDDLWRTVSRIVHPQPWDSAEAARRAFTDKLDAYVTASDTHPVPRSLALQCTR